MAEETAALIWRHWCDGTVMDALPEAFRPQSIEQGYLAQAALEGLSASPRAGWKIAATSEAGQRHIGVDGPLAGRVFAETVFESGAERSIATNRMRVAEPEFCFRFERPLTPRERKYSTDEVMENVGALHLSLELPDSRFLDFVTTGTPSLVADNSCARELILGPEVTANWRALDLSGHRVHATVGDRYRRDGIGSNVLGDPRVALTWLVNEVTGQRITIGAGEIVTTGTCAAPLELEPGDHVVADFGELGTIEVRIAEGEE